MKKFIGSLAILFALFTGLASAQPAPNGISAPVGFKWVVSYDEEFTQESAINTSVWDQNANYSLSATNGLALQGLTSGATTRASAVNTNDSITQRYGVWEWLAKYPHNDSGEATGYHADLYIANQGSQFPNYIENDICEWDTAFTPALACQDAVNDTQINGVGRGDQQPATFLTHLPNGGSGSPPIGDAFHTYAVYWANDGTAHGTVSEYFDGAQQTNTIWSLTNPRWDQGARPLMIEDSCASCGTANNNPFLVKYFRVWHLVQTGPTPTPTSTSGSDFLTPIPTSSPTPAACNISLSVAPSVTSPVTFAPVVSGCPGWPSAQGFVRVEQTSPGSTHYDGNPGTTSTLVSLSNGNYSFFVTLWSNGVSQVGGNSNSVNVAVVPPPTPTPKPPTPTPQPTPTPGPCTADISAYNGGTFASPITITPVVSGCGSWPGSTGFVRFEQTLPGTIHFDGTPGTNFVAIHMSANSHSGYATLWADSVTQIGGPSGTVTFNISASPTPTPTPLPPTPTPTLQPPTPTPAPMSTPQPPTPTPTPGGPVTPTCSSGPYRRNVRTRY